MGVEYLTFRPSVNETEILEILKPMIKRYALEKQEEGLSPPSLI